MHGPEKTRNFAEPPNKNLKQSNQTKKSLNKMDIQLQKRSDYFKNSVTIFHKKNALFGIFQKEHYSRFQ